MFEKLEEVKAAKAKVLEGALTIWNARLDAIAKSGDLRSYLDHLLSPVEFGDNCDCGCGEGMSPQHLYESGPITKK